MTPRPAQRTTVRILPRILAAAVLAAACSDSIGPGRGPAPPLFSFSPNGITLDQQNSTMAEGGRRLVKGFNPTNPQNGDAIVVTLFWVGQTNIVDSVTDHLVNNAFTTVGNTYHLVEYVTAGGVSMATFVATNVQNIPLANPNGEDVLAVVADLRDSVPDGGIWMSSWRGVEDVYAQALGATHPSASGAGAAPTAAHPGTVTTVNPGALIYGVTMARPPVGVDPPPGFTHIDPFDNIGDATLKADARYAVEANPTPVDPTWTWYYDQTHAGTWLATGLVLKAATNTTTTGNLTATTNTTGSNLDPDGYTVTVDGTTSQPIATNGSVTFNNLAAGNHTVALSGVATNCTVGGGASQTVTVPPGGTASANFSVSCTALNQPPSVNAGPDETVATGLLYSFSPSFSDPDNDGPWSYTIDWGDGSQTTGSLTTQGSFTATHTYVVVLPQSFTVTVTVTDSHGASGSDTKAVSVRPF